jgi:hypothetical protein
MPQTVNSKPTNPKEAIGDTKLPLHLWPSTATAYGCLGFLEGALKYGKQNFRSMGVRASTYLSAAKRHLDAWDEGEDVTPDTGIPHLANAIACVAILIEAVVAENLNDDRSYKTNYRKMVDELTPHVARLKEMFKGYNPKHFSIKDNVKQEPPLKYLLDKFFVMDRLNEKADTTSIVYEHKETTDE